MKLEFVKLNFDMELEFKKIEGLFGMWFWVTTFSFQIILYIFLYSFLTTHIFKKYKQRVTKQPSSYLKNIHWNLSFWNLTYLWYMTYYLSFKLFRHFHYIFPHDLTKERKNRATIVDCVSAITQPVLQKDTATIVDCVSAAEGRCHCVDAAEGHSHHCWLCECCRRGLGLHNQVLCGILYGTHFLKLKFDVKFEF